MVNRGPESRFAVCVQGFNNRQRVAVWGSANPKRRRNANGLPHATVLNILRRDILKRGRFFH